MAEGSRGDREGAQKAKGDPEQETKERGVNPRVVEHR